MQIVPQFVRLFLLDEGTQVCPLASRVSPHFNTAIVRETPRVTAPLVQSPIFLISSQFLENPDTGIATPREAKISFPPRIVSTQSTPVPAPSVETDNRGRDICPPSK